VLSDQLSDYEGEDGYTTAHVDIRSSRSARDFGRASGMLHTEEVTGSNPVSPTQTDRFLTSGNAAVGAFSFGELPDTCQIARPPTPT
jgi:hypothetical protein